MSGKKRNYGNCIGYLTGWVGYAVFAISQAEGFWMGVLGVVKSLVWPAFVVYDLLTFIHLN